MERLKIFISGTQDDMQPEREAADRAVNTTILAAGIRAETTVSQPKSSRNWIEQQIQECNIFIGIYSHRYGWIISGEDISATEFEFELARKLGKPILIWIRSLRDEEKDKPDYDRQNQFLKKVSDFSSGYLRQEFDNSTDLEEWIKKALGDTFTEIIRRGTSPISDRANFLTPIEFTSRASRTALVGHPGQMVGRHKELEQLVDLTTRDSGLVILHAPGGIGKTRLLIDFSSNHSQTKPLWFLDTDVPILDFGFEIFRNEQKHIVILDDAHRFPSLQALRELLLSSQFANRIFLILVTRSVYVDELRRVFSGLSSDQIVEIELSRLNRMEISAILEQMTLPKGDMSVASELISTADGFPLFVHVGMKLVQSGVAVSKLSRSELLSRYLDELFDEIGEPVQLRQAIEYLGLITLLGGISLVNGELRAKIRDAISLELTEEIALIERLENARLIERYGQIIRVGSEVMADYIITQRLLGEKQAAAKDYRRRVIDIFLPLYPKQILTKLARLEIQEESRTIGTLLGQKLDEFYRIVDKEGNVPRLAILEWLDEVALVRPNEILRIIARIVDGEALPDETHMMQFWGEAIVTHQMVMDKVITLLDRVKYRAFHDAVMYLHKIALYHLDSLDFALIREKAAKVLIQLSGYELHKPFHIQLFLITKIEHWLNIDFEHHFDLAVKMLSPMLAFSFHSSYLSPEQPHTVVWGTHTFRPSDPLHTIRTRVLDLLFELYTRAPNILMRQRAIMVLEDVIPRFTPDSQIPASSQEWLFMDFERVIIFFHEIMAGNNIEMPILDKIWNWVWRVRRFGGFQSDALETIRVNLKTNVRYQLYRATIGWHHFEDEDGESLNWQERDEKRREIALKLVDQLSDENYLSTLETLEEISNQATAVQERSIPGLGLILQKIGELKPRLAKRLISDTFEQNLTLKKHLSFVVAGIKVTEPDIAREYIHEWGESSEETLVMIAAHSFQLGDLNQAAEEDWEQIRRLAYRNICSVNLQIVWLIPSFASQNQSLAVELIKVIGATADNEVLGQIAQVLAWPDRKGDGWIIKFEDPEEYIEVVHYFVSVPHLDFHIEECLNRLGAVDPWAVLNFIEARINEQQQRQELAKDNDYDALSFSMRRAFQNIRLRPEYIKILCRIRDWAIQSDPLIRWEAGRLLHEVAGVLDGTMERVLMEWVESDDLGKMRAVAHILHGFNSGLGFYRLARELIVRVDDEKISSALSAAISTTPGTISGPFSAFHSQRIQEIEPWLNDENFRVRAFAQRAIAIERESMEQELANEALEERKWPDIS